MVDEAKQAVDTTAEEVTDAPMPPEMAEAIEEFIPGPAELAVVDANDRHEVMLSMDEHDVRMLLTRVQSSALKKWVYVLPYGGGEGLTVHAVQDITQMMNWMGKCRIGVVPETLSVEQVTADAGNGDEPFWVATIFARDEMTGAALPGSSMEPQRMRLREQTARTKRNNGMKIPEDNTIFDTFSRTKAIQKATRNALAAFIPEEIEQTVIAMFKDDPARVERIQTEQEQKMADHPPALDDDEARELRVQAEKVYDEIRELGGGQGKVDMPPGTYGAWMLRAQHSHESLRGFVAFLEQRRDEIAAKYGGES